MNFTISKFFKILSLCNRSIGKYSKELTLVVIPLAPVAHQVNLPSHQFFLHAVVHIYEVQPVCHDGSMHTISITFHNDNQSIPVLHYMSLIANTHKVNKQNILYLSNPFP